MAQGIWQIVQGADQGPHLWNGFMIKVAFYLLYSLVLGYWFQAQIPAGDENVLIAFELCTL